MTTAAAPHAARSRRYFPPRPHHRATHEIIDECPSCAGAASGIVMWANEIRERRPSREELTALVDATCPGLPEDQSKLLIEGLRALVRFAES